MIFSGDIGAFFHLKNWAIYLFFIFYCLVSFGAGTGAHYVFAPYLLLTSLICIIIYNKSGFKHLPYVFKPLCILCFLTVAFSYNYITFDYPPCSFIQYFSYSLLPYATCFALYFLASSGRRLYQLIIVFFLLFYIVGVVRFFHEEGALEYFGSDFRANNSFYFILMPLPIVLLMKKNNLLKILAICMSFYLCILSLKRSALVAIILIAVIYIFFEILINTKSRLYGLMIVAGLILFTPQFIDVKRISESYTTTMERMDNITEDGGSGRFQIVDNFFMNDIYDGGIILGRGFMGYHDKYPSVIAAHNDLIEIFYSYGIIGLIALIVFICWMCKRTILLLKEHNPIVLSYLTAFILLVLYSFASGLFSFINLSLPFFSYLALSEAKLSSNYE